MLLIQNGNLYLGSGRYERGWDVLCENGRIQAVGPNLSADGAEVIDARDMDVYPGLVLGLCSVGAVSFSEFLGNQADHNESSAPILPQMDIRDAFDFEELKRQRFGRVGITSYGLCPGTSALVAGQISLIHVDAPRASDVFVAERIAVKGNYTNAAKGTFATKGNFMTRMGMYQCLDEAFRKAREYMEKEEKEYDACNETMCRMLRREVPFVVAAETAAEVEAVIRLGEKYDLRLVISGGFGAAGAAEKIIEKGWHLMLGDSGFMEIGLKCGMQPEKLVELYRQGLKLSLSCSGDAAYPPAYEQLLWTAARMCAAGAEGYELMDMMTIEPARALGVDHLVGSIEPGKMADVIVCSGNPATRFDHRVEKTIVGGRVFFERRAN